MNIYTIGQMVIILCEKRIGDIKISIVLQVKASNLFRQRQVSLVHKFDWQTMRLLYVWSCLCQWSKKESLQRMESSSRYTNARLKSYVLTSKKYPESFAEFQRIQRILKLFTHKVYTSLKKKATFNVFFCFCLFRIKHFAKFTGK